MVMQRPFKSTRSKDEEAQFTTPSRQRKGRTILSPTKESTRATTNFYQSQPFRRNLWYGGFLLVGCYLQVFVSFVVFYKVQNYPENLPNLHFRYWMPMNLIRNDRSDPEDLQEYYSPQDYQTRLELINQMDKLNQRAERLFDPKNNDLLNRNSVYHEDGRFFPFTIRDARRTVPTQIRHGFHVFDFIDVHNYDTYSFPDDDVDTDFLSNDTRFPTSNKTSIARGDAAKVPPEEQEDGEGGKMQFPAPLFHNGFPVRYPYNTSVVVNATADCQQYSVACYRSNLLQVLRYLLDAPKFRNFTYFFYMESDHDLCTSLTEIRSLAYRYERYFMSTGIGTSGWIMSRSFLQDFYEVFSANTINHKLVSAFNVSQEQRLHPDIMASILLREKRAWSVTRRYLTSHTILFSTSNGVVDMSLTELFDNRTNSTTKTAEEGRNSKVTYGIVNTTAPTNAKKVAGKTPEMLPPMLPKQHLPRCLEPHRGIVKRYKNAAPATGSDKNKGNNEGQKTNDDLTDMNLWDFFDYDTCPDSDIFPCKEGQLDSLVAEGRKSLRGAAAIT
jgi:hypothetical protein